MNELQQMVDAIPPMHRCMPLWKTTRSAWLFGAGVCSPQSRGHKSNRKMWPINLISLFLYDHAGRSPDALILYPASHAHLIKDRMGCAAVVGSVLKGGLSDDDAAGDHLLTHTLNNRSPSDLKSLCGRSVISRGAASDHYSIASETS